MASHVTTRQDPVELAPHIYHVALNNERVRVLDIRLGPGERIPQHSHPNMVIYAVNDGKVKFTFPDGRTEGVQLSAGQAVWMEPLSHAVENIGGAELHVLNIEFKR